MAPSDLGFNVDAALERLSAGRDLTADELARLADSPDILPLGMLADTLRRRLCGASVSFVRVALIDATLPSAPEALPAAAQEARLTGSPVSFEEALTSVSVLRTLAGPRVVSGFSWVDVETWGPSSGGTAKVLARLRAAGLDTLAEIPLDLVDDVSSALAALAEGGFGPVRLTVARPAPTPDRLRLFLRAAPLVARGQGVAAIAPLPMSLNPLRPTTGYDDVKVVALARLAMPQVPHVQVDWRRYGPKLAQVALTFGADDLDSISPSDEAPDGRRRAAVEELRTNIQSAGFTAVERDGRFAALAG